MVAECLCFEVSFKLIVSESTPAAFFMLMPDVLADRCLDTDLVNQEGLQNNEDTVIKSRSRSVGDSEGLKNIDRTSELGTNSGTFVLEVNLLAPSGHAIDNVVTHATFATSHNLLGRTGDDPSTELDQIISNVVLHHAQKSNKINSLRPAS